MSQPSSLLVAETGPLYGATHFPLLNSILAGIRSFNSGATRPANLAVGEFWIKEIATDDHRLMRYQGSDVDLETLLIDPENEIVVARGGLIRPPTRILASGTHTLHPFTKIALVELQAGGGAGGGSPGPGGTGGSSAGAGGNGGELRRWWPTLVDAERDIVFVLGAAGVGVSGAAGGDASDSTATYDDGVSPVTITADGGEGGGAATTASLAIFANVAATQKAAAVDGETGTGTQAGTKGVAFGTGVATVARAHAGSGGGVGGGPGRLSAGVTAVVGHGIDAKGKGAGGGGAISLNTGGNGIGGDGGEPEGLVWEWA